MPNVTSQERSVLNLLMAGLSFRQAAIILVIWCVSSTLGGCCVFAASLRLMVKKIPRTGLLIRYDLPFCCLIWPLRVATCLGWAEVCQIDEVKEVLKTLGLALCHKYVHTGELTFIER